MLTWGMDEAAVGPVDAGLDGRAPAGEAGDRIADRAFLDALAGDLPRIQRIALAACSAIPTRPTTPSPRPSPARSPGGAPAPSTIPPHTSAPSSSTSPPAAGGGAPSPAGATTRPPGGPPYPADTASVAAERDRTLRAVGRLPARRRAVVVLRFYDDLSEQEIATVLGVRIGTVKSQLSRALGQLRRDLGTPEET